MASDKKIENAQRLRYIRLLERFFNSVISYLSNTSLAFVSSICLKSSFLISSFATSNASVVATNGNLHLDSKNGFGTFLNYYRN